MSGYRLLGSHGIAGYNRPDRLRRHHSAGPGDGWCALCWKQANRRVFAGLTAGAAIWFYTLIVPLLGWLALEMFPGLSWMYNGGRFRPQRTDPGVTLSLIGQCDAVLLGRS